MIYRDWIHKLDADTLQIDGTIDASATLAEAYVAAAGSLSSQTLRAGEFLMMYCGYDTDTVELVQRHYSYKLRQNPGTLGAIRKGLEAFSLNSFFNKINMNLGGK